MMKTKYQACMLQDWDLQYTEWAEVSQEFMERNKTLRGFQFREMPAKQPEGETREEQRARVHAKVLAMPDGMPDTVGPPPACDIPPAGWRCTRMHGHSGPCAALPSEPLSKQDDDVLRNFQKECSIVTKALSKPDSVDTRGFEDLAHAYRKAGTDAAMAELLAWHSTKLAEACAKAIKANEFDDADVNAWQAEADAWKVRAEKAEAKCKEMTRLYGNALDTLNAHQDERAAQQAHAPQAGQAPVAWRFKYFLNRHTTGPMREGEFWHNGCMGSKGDWQIEKFDARLTKPEVILECEELVPRAPPAPEPVTQAWQAPLKITCKQIHDVFLANGFTIKEGHMDLKAYVYDAARALLALAAQPASEPVNQEAPIDMVLHCPACGLQHIDVPDTRKFPAFGPGMDVEPWTNPPHRSHLCHACGHIWRPADVPTNGVAAVTTTGSEDSPIAAPVKRDSLSADGQIEFMAWFADTGANGMQYKEAQDAFLAIYQAARKAATAPVKQDGQAVDDRAAFEKWANDKWFSHGVRITYHPSCDEYDDREYQASYEAWKARAALAAPVEQDGNRRPYIVGQALISPIDDQHTICTFSIEDVPPGAYLYRKSI